MACTLTHYRTAAILTAAMTLAITAPAGARPFDVDSQGSSVPVNINPPAVQSVAPSSADGGISDLAWVGIATSGVAVALIGTGGVRTATRRRRHEAEPRLAAGAITER